MRITVAIGLGLALAANGLLMLFDPAGWYAVAPGVPDTGPLNPHFVRDIGCAYILTGFALAGLVQRARVARSADRRSVPDAACARSRRRRFLRPGHANPVLTDLVAVYAPAAVALRLVLLSTPHLREAIAIMSTRP